MNLPLVEKIANAVLYEGYILYPYRPSAVKNQQRWTFGVLCPPSYSAVHSGSENCRMQTECLVVGNAHTTVKVKVRFLQLVRRDVARLKSGWRSPVTDEYLELVPAFEINGELIQTWQEAMERDVVIPDINLSHTEESEWSSFSFPAVREVEMLREKITDEVMGAVVRRQEAIGGELAIRLAACPQKFNSATPNDTSRIYKLTAEINNTTTLDDPRAKSRDDALLRSLVSTHTILHVENGTFVSVIDPPAEYRELASSCVNSGTYPVLVGEEGTTDCFLSSPIILYDYPQIAVESAGDLFDGTEIDEILTLRIMTLTDEEKREMRGADQLARQLLERTESLPIEQFMKLHGAMKSKI